MDFRSLVCSFAFERAKSVIDLVVVDGVDNEAAVGGHGQARASLCHAGPGQGLLVRGQPLALELVDARPKLLSASSRPACNANETRRKNKEANWGQGATRL